MSMPGNDGPYRNEVDKIMAGKAKVEDTRESTNGAKIFDSLVSTNVELVKAMKAGMKAGVALLVIFAMIAGVLMTSAIVVLRAGQADTRELIAAIRMQQHCSDSHRKD